MVAAKGITTVTAAYPLHAVALSGQELELLFEKNCCAT